MLLGNKTNHYVLVETYTIPGATFSIIAIQGHNYQSLGGIIGNFSDGLLTDDTWKCTRNFSANWYLATFDDCAWPSAVALEVANSSKWYKTPIGISMDAKWIWSGSYDDEFVDVYCRKKIGK